MAYIKDSDNKDLVSKWYDFGNKPKFMNSSITKNSLVRSNNFVNNTLTVKPYTIRSYSTESLGKIKKNKTGLCGLG